MSALPDPPDTEIGKRVIEFKALEGWKCEEKTGVLHVKGGPDN